MPIYEYECDACGHRLEKLQKLSDDLLKECPSCGEHELRKLISRAGFRLKGSGWYATDFKDQPKDKKPAEDSKTDKQAEKPATDKKAGSATKSKDSGSPSKSASSDD